jgi:hypothetical protein
MAIAAEMNKKLSGTGDGEDSKSYRAMLSQLTANFAKNTKTAQVLFSVAGDKSVLWNLYLKQFPAEHRQHYTCNECRKFFERYADLVTIDAKGNAKSVMFSDSPSGDFAYIFDNLRAVIEGSTVEKMFVTSEKKWGIAVTGQWEHFAVVPPKKFVFVETLDSKGEPLETAYQAEAKKTAEFNTMVRALVEYSAETLETAMSIINADVLFRGDAVAARAKWLQDVILTQKKTKNARNRHNLLWLAVATAPVGFAKPRGNSLGSLLDNIAEGKDLDQVRAEFAAVMDPSKHGRPQTAPGAGNIQQAERVIDALGMTSALDRRFARIEEIQKMWVPRPVHAGGTSGVFGHLAPRDRKKAEATQLNLPSKKMTLEKFVTTVVPTAEEIEVKMQSVMPFIALLTQTDPNAKPILQWDDAKKRNPFSWYVYTQGAAPSQWGAKIGEFVKVNALTAGPSQWNPKIKLPQHGERLIFVLDGVRDSNGENVGLGLFPEYLVSELHPVRKTIEAHSASGKLSGLRQATASGVVYTKANGGSLFVRVKAKGGTVQQIEIDRWD